MYTLKIRQTLYTRDAPEAPSAISDEATMFIPAEMVTAHGIITDDSQMNGWAAGSYTDLRDWIDVRCGEVGERQFHIARLIEVRCGPEHTWYLASWAWLLSENGQTIERIAP